MLHNNHTTPSDPQYGGLEELCHKVTADFLSRRQEIALRRGDRQAGNIFAITVWVDYQPHFWGILDLSIMPEEDVYTEMVRRCMAAWIAHDGQKHISDFGIIDIRNVLNGAVYNFLTPRNKH